MTVKLTEAVVPSTGCVFCDLLIEPTRNPMTGRWCHEVKDGWHTRVDCTRFEKEAARERLAAD